MVTIMEYNMTCLQIGVHGIQIEFPLKGAIKTATYLPEVSREQGSYRFYRISLFTVCNVTRLE